MNEKTAGTVRLIYGIFLSVLVAVMAVCFAVSCILIYKSGERPFSPDSIAMHFDRVAVPVYVGIAAIVGGGILDMLLPAPDKKIRGRFFTKNLLARAYGRRGPLAPDVAAAARREQTVRRALGITTAVVWIGCAIPALIYLLNPAHFPNANQNPTPEVIAACRLVLPLAAAALCFTLAAVLLCEHSLQKELRLVKNAETAADSPTEDLPKAAPRLRAFWDSHKESVVLALRIALPVLALLFILLGALGGDVADVLGKAVRICTECIGLG